MKEIFDSLDHDHNGKLTGKEVLVGVEHYLGKQLTKEQINTGRVLFEANAGTDKTLDFKEFEHFAQQIKPFLEVAKSD